MVVSWEYADPMSAGTSLRARFHALVGTRRGRVLAAVLVSCVLLGLPTVVTGYVNHSGYLALRFLQHAVVVAVSAATAAALLFVAGWLVTRKRPASIIIRSIAGVLAVVLCGVCTLWSVAIDSLQSEILKVEVLAVSPDGRFEVIQVVTKDWKGGMNTDLRLRSRAGLLSRESEWALASCNGNTTDRLRADFADSRSVRVDAGGATVTVGFDAETMKPDRSVNVC